MKIFSLVSFVFFALILCAAQAIAATTPPKGAVLTRSNDNFRTELAAAGNNPDSIDY